MKKYQMFYLKSRRARKALDGVFFAKTDKEAISYANRAIAREYFGEAKLLNVFKEEAGKSVSIIRR